MAMLIGQITSRGSSFVLRRIEELVSKENSTSVVWEWFGYAVSDISQAKDICKLCRATVGSSGGKHIQPIESTRKNMPTVLHSGRHSHTRQHPMRQKQNSYL